MEDRLLKLLSAGGDVGVYVLLFVAWNFDKRVTHLEYLINA
ncbi:hypothetical protein [Kiloniella spongiae]|nr:hypothetical protein [Kiloniella spongiae]